MEKKYFYIFNNREMADRIKEMTGESYMKFDRPNNGKAYSFKNTEKFKMAYTMLKSYENN